MYKLMDTQNCQINLALTFHNIPKHFISCQTKPALLQQTGPVSSHYVTGVSDVETKKAMSFMKTFTVSGPGLST